MKERKVSVCSGFMGEGWRKKQMTGDEDNQVFEWKFWGDQRGTNDVNRPRNIHST